MTLSDEIIPCNADVIISEHQLLKTEDVKRFIKETEKENNNFEKDIIFLIEINNYGKEDLIVRMKRLCKAHKEEREKLAGDKLI